jgi:hypothetical protein
MTQQNQSSGDRRTPRGLTAGGAGALLCLLLLAIGLGGGCAPSSPRDLYEPASRAVMTDKDFPPNAVLLPRSQARFFVAKNLACVYVPYEFADAAGQKVRDTYTVWLKRIAIRWEVDRCRPTAKYPASDPAGPPLAIPQPLPPG